MKPTQPPAPIDAAAYQRLRCENEDLRRRLAEAEVALCAMREGRVDAVATGEEYLRKDGTRIPVELLVHLVRNRESQPDFYFAFVTEISERKRMEQALRE